MLEKTNNYVDGYWDQVSPDLDMASYDDAYSESLYWVNQLMGAEAY